MNYKLKAQFNHYKHYLMAGSGILGIVLLSLTIVIPKLNLIIQHYQQIVEKQEQSNRLMRKRLLLESMSSDSTINLLREAESALPQQKDAASILIAMENLASLTSFTIDDVSLSPGVVSTISANIADTTVVESTKREEIRNGAYVLPVRLLGRGTSSQLRTFLDQLTISRRVFDIQKLSLHYFIDTPDFLSAELLLLVYYLPPIDEIGGLDTELPQITPEEQTLLENLRNRPYISQSLLRESSNFQEPTGKKNLFDQ